MRKITFKTEKGDIEIEASSELIARIARRSGLPDNAVSDMMVLKFLQEASDGALKKASTEYLDSDGKNS